ncbi:hypothetical protein Mapa_000546 [Marchantia paleacea]|nr:hypothetical protein Mapa_000546 [Marchantia paleacea]
MHSSPGLDRGHGDTSTSTCDFHISGRPSSVTVVTQMFQRSTRSNAEDGMQLVTTRQARRSTLENSCGLSLDRVLWTHE